MKSGIVAFAFGKPDYLRANRILAQITSKKALEEKDCPIFTQEDIPLQGENFEIIKNKKGEPPSTLEIAKAAVSWAKRNKINKLIIVSACPHLWRCKRDLSRIIKERQMEIEIQIAEEITKIPQNFWFCPKSHQKRTQKRFNWLIREAIIKIMPFLIYRRIT
ncbi:MAG: hypothetical protein U5L76_03250 [Patescibacteria group bacterium]|nr:hypothetical protein [Patescibacteria group bacterium]